MRILFNYFSGGGGAWSNFSRLLRSIARQYPGDYIGIVHSGHLDLEPLQGISNVETIDYLAAGSKEVQRARLGFRDLGRLARENNADVVWSLNLGSYVDSEIPQVLSVNNAYQVYPWAVARLHPTNILNVAALRWCSRRSIRSSRAVIVQTSIMGGYIRRMFGDDMRISVVPKAVESHEQGLPLPQATIEMLEAGCDIWRFTFVYVATCLPHKNHKAIVDAFAHIASENLQIRAILTVTRSELEDVGGRVASGLIESGHLVPIGWVANKCLRCLYEYGDACLMPSMLESLSSAHLEAMQWAKPQIVSELPYARELCGTAALYVPPEDARSWADAIKSLAADATLQTYLVEQGKGRMKSFPATWADVANQTRVVLASVVQSHAGGESSSKGVSSVRVGINR